MKNKLVIFITILFVILLGSYFYGSGKLGQRENTQSIEISPAPKQAQVTLTLDFGDEKISTYSSINTTTAFEALEIVSQSQNFELQSKEYDFGILVEAINGYQNDKTKSWMYYVNNILADKAADQYELKDGDQIIWKYEKPKF